MHILYFIDKIPLNVVTLSHGAVIEYFLSVYYDINLTRWFTRTPTAVHQYATIPYDTIDGGELIHR